MRELASTCNAKNGWALMGLCLLTPVCLTPTGLSNLARLPPATSNLNHQVTGSSFYIHLLFVFPCISLIFSSFLYSCAKRGKYTSIQIEIQIGHHTQMVFLPVYEIRGIFEDSSGWLLLAWQYQRQT